MLEPSSITPLTVRRALFALAASDVVTDRRRLAIYRALGVRVGDASTIKPRCYVNDEGSLDIGDGCHIEHCVYFECSGGITVEDRAGIGPGSMLFTSSHEIGPPEVRVGPHTYAPITIGAGTWVAAHVVVLPGVTIGPGVVVAAGSVVTADCEANAVYAGVPARKVRDITEPGVPPTGVRRPPGRPK